MPLSLMIFLGLSGCAMMKHVEPIDLTWVMVGEGNSRLACLPEKDVQKLREYIIRLNP